MFVSDYSSCCLFVKTSCILLSSLAKATNKQQQHPQSRQLEIFLVFSIYFFLLLLFDMNLQWLLVWPVPFFYYKQLYGGCRSAALCYYPLHLSACHGNASVSKCTECVYNQINRLITCLILTMFKQHPLVWSSLNESKQKLLLCWIWLFPPSGGRHDRS